MSWYGKTCADLVNTVGDEYPERVLAYFKNDKITYGEFIKKVDILAKGLLSLGIEKGEHVILLMPNCIEWLIIMLAVQKIGSVIIPLNTRYKVHELDYLLSQSDASTVFIMDKFLNINFVQMLYELCPELENLDKNSGKKISKKYPYLKRVVCLSKSEYTGMFSFKEVSDDSRNRLPENKLKDREREVSAEDVCLIAYTTGTTSFPKGVMHTHNNILQHAYNYGKNMKFGQDSIYLAMVPLFGAWGMLNTFMVLVHHGGMVINDIYDASVNLELINRFGITHFFGTDAMYGDLLSVPKFSEKKPQTLYGGMIALFAGQNDQLMLDVRNKLGMEYVCQAYGLSEANAGVIMGHWKQPFDERARSLGKPNKGIEIRLVDATSMQDVNVLEEGEIWVRGYIVMKGYYNKPDETAKALDDNGWLHTEDIGMKDKKGNYYFRGRYKDMYKQSGFNVSPAEVEEVIKMHNAVEEVYVVGVPHERLAEVGMAFVKRKKGSGVKDDEILQWCKEKLANFKVPHYVEFVSDFPTITAGAGTKVQKYRLREIGIDMLRDKKGSNNA